MKDDFFVGLYEPLDVRRNLLESSKEVVKSLQAFEKLSEIRRNKLRYYEQMRGIMDELNFLTSKLRTKLPESHLRKTNEKIVMTKEVPSEEMRKLEDEFRKIEREFSDL